MHSKLIASDDTNKVFIAAEWELFWGNQKFVDNRLFCEAACVN